MGTDVLLTNELALALLESAPDGVLMVDDSGTIRSANLRLAELFGYEQHELVGSPVEMLVPERLRGPHLAHRTRFRVEPAVRSMGAGRTLKGRCRDGSELSVQVGLSPVASDSESLVMAIVRDVSEQTALRAQADVVQQTIDRIRDGVFMFDPTTLRFGYVNEGAVRQTGYSRAELLEMSPLHIKPLYTEARFRAMLEPLIADRQESVDFETVHRRRDGVDIPVEIILEYPLLEDPDLPRPLVAIVRDISERKEAEHRRTIAEQARERFEEQGHLISRLRLRLLGAQALTEVLRSLCDDLRRSGLVSDATILEHDLAAGVVVAWGASHDAGPFDPTGYDDAPPFFGVRGDQAPRVLRAGEVETDAERELLDGFAAHTMIITPIGHRALGLLCTRDDSSGHDLDVLRRLAVEVGEAIELAEARADQQRVRLLEDRERIATDLHDVVIQRLFAAGMRLQAALPLLDEATRNRLQAVVGELDTTIAEIRDTIFAIHQGESRGGPLSVQIEAAVMATHDYLGFAPHLHIEGDVDALSSTLSDQVIPALTEMLSNVARHAIASATDIVIEVTDDRLEVTVVDNGVGIDPDAPPGNGLVNLDRRARDLGGEFVIAPDSGGRGTRARWSVRPSHGD